MDPLCIKSIHGIGFILGLALVLSLAVHTNASAQRHLNIKAAPDDEIVELPRYVVTDERILPPPESWRHAKLPGYEILSNASTRATRRFLEDFQQLQQALHIVWPTLIDRKINVPTLIVVCGRGNSFRPFVEKAREDGIFITPMSLFVEDKERGAIVIDFFFQEMGDFGVLTSINDPSDSGMIDASTEGAFAEASISGGSSASFASAIDPYQEFYRQYARFLMRRANDNKPLPPWLEEGLTRLFATLDVRKKNIEFGRVEYFGGGRMVGMGSMVGDSAAEKAAFNPIFVAFGHLDSLDKIIDYVPGSELPRPSNWANACFAFVHMCLYGYQKKYQKGFLSFSRRAMTGPVTEADFKECFGRTHKQMTMLLRGYVEASDHGSILFKAKKGTDGLGDLPPIEIREATQAEIGRIKGEALRLANNMDASREAFIIPYLRQERDAGLLASLGLLEALEQRGARARKFLEAAAKENVVRPRAYVELARLRLNEALAAPAGSNGRLSAAQTANVLEPLFTARTQPPPMEDVYSLIGYTWMCSDATPKESHLEVLLEGALIFPGSARIMHHAATLYALHGSNKTLAKSLVDMGVRISPDQETRESFESLRSRLEQEHVQAAN
ncbi:hypothetical protein M2447_001927 [Ereboglobus sp. PH5-10]|uniref:hypothetical protein n=1 Tax=Ereboglobus sp. PH5-10 TaxID=2940629 RepID=UPI002404D6AC|nr:hypothetical protein [Ereboglobus sp. PH5-10]MDF9827825.1 hypothetical protein [Ereboglobus sp. PH5-10]